MLKKSALILASLLQLVGCSKDVPLYSGYHFDAKINDANVIELKDSSSIPALAGYVRTVRWQLDKPIDGAFSVTYGKNKNSKDFVGRILRREAMDIIPLQSISVATNSQTQSDASVQINGGAAMSQVDVLNKNVLPAGEYVFRLKIHGTNNWDRKEIYVKVK